MRVSNSIASPKRKSGFTLLELSVTIMIIGILAAVAVPVYSDSLARFRVDIAAQRIAQDIATTQRSARQTNSTQTVTFTTSDDSCVINGLSSLDRVSQPYRVSFNQSPYQVDISSLVTAANPSSQLPSVSVAFNSFGMPDQGISVTVRAGAFQKRVDLAPISGRVTIQ
ncbi:MAG: type II secretion system protein [Planctomycetota bacterium]|nr:type II secretion system protein [Planctomycetota bacterium]